MSGSRILQKQRLILPRYLAGLYLCLFLMLCASSHAASLPVTLDEVDEYWKTASRVDNLPSLKELAEDHPNNPVAVRILDLTLMKYHERGQIYLCHELTSKVTHTTSTSLLGLWAYAWRKWLCVPYSNSCKIDLSSLRAKTSESTDLEQSLLGFLENFPNDMTGALSARLLFIFGNRFGRADLEKIIREQPNDSLTYSVFAVMLGNECASKREWDKATMFWLNGMARYPFAEESNAIREKVTNALGNMGRDSMSAISDMDIEGSASVDYLTALLKVRKAKQLQKEGSLALALKELEEITIGTSAEEDRFYRDLRNEIDLQSALIRIRMDVGTPRDICLDKIFTMEDRHLAAGISDAIKSYACDERFVNALFGAIEKRSSGLIGPLTASCWRIVAIEPSVGAEQRVFAFSAWLECENLHYQLLRSMLCQPITWQRSLVSSMRRKIEAQEEQLLDALDVAEQFLARQVPTSDAVDLADAIYSMFRSLGIRNRPESLYKTLAGHALESQLWSLGKHAEKMGETDEAADILALLASKKADVCAETDAEIAIPDIALYRIHLLNSRGRIWEAVRVADALVEAAEDNTSNLNQGEWMDLAEFYVDAKQYGSALAIADKQRSLSVHHDTLNSNYRLKRILALSAYRFGRYNESIHLIEELETIGKYCRNERSQLAQAKVYCLLAMREYDQVPDALQDYLKNYSPDLEERLSLEALLRQFQAHTHILEIQG